jgi:amidase
MRDRRREAGSDMPLQPEAGTSPAAAELVRLDAVDLARAIRDRAVSCVEVMAAYLDQIERLNPQVNAIVSLQDPELLLRRAAERDRQLARGQYLGVLHGFPQAIKDLALTKGVRTTMGSPIFADFVPDQDELYVQRMKQHGAIVIGKTNTAELGLGSQTYNPVFGATRNPYDPTRTAGGSSGGAAAALALRMQPVADGSDFGGSLRNPAAFCNVFGFRPSFGRVPSYPAVEVFVAQGSVAGPMARTVADLALLLSVMAGDDDRFPLALGQDPASFAAAGRLQRDFRNVRVAFTGDWDGYLPMEPGVLELCRAALPVFEALGCVVEEALPDFPTERLWPLWLTFRHWLCGGALHPFYQDPATRSLLKPEAVFEVEGMLRLTALDVWRNSVERSAWYQAVRALLDTYEYLLAPAAQVFPFDAGLTWPRQVNGVRMDTYHRWMEVTFPWTLAGLPVAGVPVGFNADGLPMGMQLIGRRHADLAVLRLAFAYEQATRWVERRPPPLLAGADAATASGVGPSCP